MNCFFFVFFFFLSSSSDPRALLFLFPLTLCTRRALLPPPFFRPEILQSLGISPYFLVLKHLLNPEISLPCWKIRICPALLCPSAGCSYLVGVICSDFGRELSSSMPPATSPTCSPVSLLANSGMWQPL
ncbi:hypothetical protein SLEP1_g43702 [Rubroshorea leprosula]|uniref:Secreted protein n=1 Tax=Rubroshorea leprosula TaxID=152421 RepID=A0AAV5LEU4_9ROSI|nr:hypothetical protein SLEP1_g43702 [Rubroshorea leprosula]